MATKIQATSLTDEQLVDECKEKTNCGDCDPTITWTTPAKGKITTPPENTVVIIVDVRSSRGAIRIFRKSDSGYVDGIGTQQAGNLVIVPWNSDWYISAAGSLPVGYVTRSAV
ncbi:hypothetical protein BKA65DRAFT_545014 [Rhexocercosporidium sp. MPI-PUGE-AT-0058]|nr:hypothetical protein BKA65DRAFT_545014 [Rhexocercosporidium sp. MPI-PUGE-AT-0058]